MENFLRYLWNFGPRRYLASCWAKLLWLFNHDVSIQCGIEWLATFYGALHTGKMGDALWRFTDDDLIRLKDALDQELSRRVSQRKNLGADTHILESFL